MLPCNAIIAFGLLGDSIIRIRRYDTGSQQPDKLEQNLALLKEGHQVTPYRNPSTPTAAGGVRQHPPSPMATSKSCLPLATSGMYVRDC